VAAVQKKETLRTEGKNGRTVVHEGKKGLKSKNEREGMRGDRGIKGK